MIFAQQLGSVILTLQGEPGFRIHLQDEDAAGITAVNHPHPAFMVEEGAGIDDIGIVGCVVAAHAAFQENALIAVGTFRSVGDGQSKR